MAGGVILRGSQTVAFDAVWSAGSPSVTVVDGAPGSGKSTTLAAVVAGCRARGVRPLETSASHSESVLAFAGLADLLRDVDPTAWAHAAAPQRAALDAALLRETTPGRVVDRRSVGAGLLHVLDTLAADIPLLVAVDDARWLDRPTMHALTFALRRLRGAAPPAAAGATPP